MEKGRSMFYNDLHLFLYSVPDEFRIREGRSSSGYVSAIREDNTMDEICLYPSIRSSL